MTFAAGQPRAAMVDRVRVDGSPGDTAELGPLGVDMPVAASPSPQDETRGA